MSTDEVYDQINTLRQEAYDRYMTTQVDDPDFIAPWSGAATKHPGGILPTLDATDADNEQDLALGGVNDDWSVTVTPADLVMVWAAGDIEDEATIPGAYAEIERAFAEIERERNADPEPCPWHR